MGASAVDLFRRLLVKLISHALISVQMSGGTNAVARANRLRGEFSSRMGLAAFGAKRPFVRKRKPRGC